MNIVFSLFARRMQMGYNTSDAFGGLFKLPFPKTENGGLAARWICLKKVRDTHVSSTKSPADKSAGFIGGMKRTAGE
ncbi:MAG TPA: hypothetical protein VN366_09265 [Feifaniaceae bacterium]|nr:hypothetical protein [Feifaniaceae bacterium]